MLKIDFLSYYQQSLSELISAVALLPSADEKQVHLCSIVNARSGRCSEDCKYCAQAACYQTGAAEYSLLPDEEILAAARKAKEIGSSYFSMVTSGNALGESEFARVVALIPRIRDEVDINVCASLGSIAYDKLLRLREAGLIRYHHNLETSRSFYPQIVSTHNYDDRVKTALAVKKTGLSLCCGALFGLGESREDRIELALLLQDIDPDIIPINFLIPIPGTPLEKMPSLEVVEALKTIAIFRLMLPDAVIKLCGGREEVLGDFQSLAFMCGADGMMIGGYLTRSGRSIADDLRLVEGINSAWKK